MTNCAKRQAVKFGRTDIVIVIPLPRPLLGFSHLGAGQGTPLSPSAQKKTGISVSQFLLTPTMGLRKQNVQRCPLLLPNVPIPGKSLSR